MNVLIGEDRAIVTEIAGTTRDTLEEHIYLQGISLNVVDTAGIRDTEDVVEKIGVDRAMKAAREADLLVYVVDGSTPLDEMTGRSWIYPEQQRAGREKAIVLLNKTDLETCVDAGVLERETGCPVIPFPQGRAGDRGLEQEIKQMFYHGALSLTTSVHHQRSPQGSAGESQGKPGDGKTKRGAGAA